VVGLGRFAATGIIVLIRPLAINRACQSITQAWPKASVYLCNLAAAAASAAEFV